MDNEEFNWADYINTEEILSDELKKNLEISYLRKIIRELWKHVNQETVRPKLKEIKKDYKKIKNIIATSIDLYLNDE